MATVTVDASPATGPDPARTAGPAIADRFPATVRLGRTVRSWPLSIQRRKAAADVNLRSCSPGQHGGPAAVDQWVHDALLVSDAGRGGRPGFLIAADRCGHIERVAVAVLTATATGRSIAS